MADPPVPPPELAILLVTDAAARLAKVLRGYRAQRDPGRLEIVVVTLAGATVDRAAIVALGFPHVRVVTLAGRDIARAEDAAVRAATAPFVVFAQAHGHPRPGFVDAILARARTGASLAAGC